MTTSQIEPLAVSMKDAERLSGISRRTLYDLVHGGVIKSKKVGRRRLVIWWSLRAYLEQDDAETSER